MPDQPYFLNQVTQKTLSFLVLICLIFFLNACGIGQHINAQVPCEDPLQYYVELSQQLKDQQTQQNAAKPADPTPTIQTKPTHSKQIKQVQVKKTDKKQTTQETNHQMEVNKSDACSRLQEAIRFSMPGSKDQNDRKAINIMTELKDNELLSDIDQRFNILLLQHVSQRQELRNLIGSQDKRLKKTETQLDQLKDIETEMDKKERSVTSPVDEQ